MRRSWLFIVPALLASLSCSSSDEKTEAPTPTGKSPLELASPFVGTGGMAYCFGSASVGAVAPQGLAKVGPDTTGPWGDINFLHYSGYWYFDDKIEGFSHLHMHGTGATDYGVFASMPLDGLDASRTVRAGYGSPFRKETERASPGYYGVTLDKGGIDVELTATEHAAHHRYTFPATVASPTILFDLTHALSGGRVTDAVATLSQSEGRFSGKLHSLGGMSGGFGGYDVYFSGKVSTPWSSQRVWTGAEPAEGSSLSWVEPEGTTNDALQIPVGFALSFATPLAGPVEITIGLSLVSPEGAEANLATEIGEGASFDDTHEKTRQAWSKLLGTIAVEGGSDDDQATLYSALYHAYMMPTRVGDASGVYVAKNGVTAQANDFHYVSDLSLWDTYRTLHPLYAIVSPDRARDAVMSLHSMAQHFGFYPKWPMATGEANVMLGSSAEVVLADAYIKGVTQFDAQDAYERARAAAMDLDAPAGGRGGRSDVVQYMDLGYVPFESGRSVSQTVEYAWDDFALSNFARALGHDEDATKLAERSKGYRKLFDPQTGFLRGKTKSGEWGITKFSPISFSEDFAEANAWHTVWASMHDVDGLIALFGSRQAYIDKLSEFFDKAKQDYEDRPISDDAVATSGLRSYYWASNEPCIHTPYMFALGGRPDLTQRWVRWVNDAFFRPTPDGLPGNDDGGTMSAGYIFNALGFYPIAGSDTYVIGTPTFSKATIEVTGGQFVIEARNVSRENFYVQSATLNGQPLDAPKFKHNDLKAGGSLVFEMGPQPSAWGRVD